MQTLTINSIVEEPGEQRLSPEPYSDSPAPVYFLLVIGLLTLGYSALFLHVMENKDRELSELSERNEYLELSQSALDNFEQWCFNHAETSVCYQHEDFFKERSNVDGEISGDGPVFGDL